MAVQDANYPGPPLFSQLGVMGTCEKLVNYRYFFQLPNPLREKNLYVCWQHAPAYPKLHKNTSSF
jgi:hypothetical protein